MKYLCLECRHLLEITSEIGLALVIDTTMCQMILVESVEQCTDEGSECLLQNPNPSIGTHLIWAPYTFSSWTLKMILHLVQFNTSECSQYFVQQTNKQEQCGDGERRACHAGFPA